MSGRSASGSSTRSEGVQAPDRNRLALLLAFWPSGLVCPTCRSRPTKHARSLLKCTSCSRTFSERTGTPFARLRGETKALLQAFLMVMDRRPTRVISTELALSPTTVRALRRNIRTAIRNGHADAVSRLESFLLGGTDGSVLRSPTEDERVQECLDILSGTLGRDDRCGRCGGPLSRERKDRLVKVCIECGRPWPALIGTPVYNAKSGPHMAICASILARDGWTPTIIGRALGISRQTAARFLTLAERWRSSSNQLDEIMKHAERTALLSVLRRMASIASLGYGAMRGRR